MRHVGNLPEKSMTKAAETFISLELMLVAKRYSMLLLTTFILTGCAAAGVKSDKASSVNADLGIRYLQSGRLQLANDKLTKALEQNPNNPTSNHYYAILQQQLGDKAKAGQYFNRAVKLNPKDPEIRNNYGSFLCDNGQVQAAIQQLVCIMTEKSTHALRLLCLAMKVSENQHLKHSSFVL